MNYSLELKKLWSAIEQTADAIFITDINGIIQYINPAFEKISGYKKKEAIGKTPRIVKSGLQDEKFYERLWKTILKGKNFRGQFMNRKKSGKLLFIDHTITPITNESGKVVNFIGIWKDVSSQKDLEIKKDEFLSLASHELKTPLTTIKAYTQILGLQAKNNQNKLSLNYLGRMNEQINKLNKLINELLDVSKIQAGKLRLSFEDFDLDKLVKELSEDFNVSTSRTIEVKGKIGKNLLADRYRISQVVSNIITNAIKFSPRNTIIKIFLKNENNTALISIKDYGIGISRYDINKIFYKYYQSHQKQYSLGMGLGLYICAQIIKRHKGKIWAESAEGKGSTFYLSLPFK